MRGISRSVLGILLVSATLGASRAVDDFWLVPNAFHIALGSEVVLRGQTSSQFPTSRSAVAVERVAEATLIGSAGSTTITGLSIQGRSLLIRERPPEAGQYLVALSIRPRNIRESSAGFLRYLEAEGANAARQRVERERLLDGRDSVTRRYAKYAKTLVQVGADGGLAFDRLAGHVIEFVPLRDPSALAAGDTLFLRLLFRAAPLADATVHAEVVDIDADRESFGATTHANHGGTDMTRTFTSDASGIVRVPVVRRGMWNIRTIHVTQAPAGSGADWDAHWGTFVFALASPTGGGHQ